MNVSELTGRTVFRFFVILFAFCLCGSDVHGQSENVADLEKRISELEAENATLRKILGEVKAVLAGSPTMVADANKGPTRLRVFVTDGDWGSSSVADIKKVCDSAAMMFTPHIQRGISEPLLVENDGTGPITLFRRGENNEHIIRLDTKNRAWAQLAFQFSHELCHVMCNYRDVKNAQLWFEETICEVASLFALRQMAKAWEQNPPYSNWKSYSTALQDYADQRIQRQDVASQSLEKLYTDNSGKLQSSGTNRDINNQVAIKLLPIFEERPSAWEAIRFLNLGPAKENENFDSYLRGWHARVPEQQKAVVKEIAAKFGVNL